MLGQHSWSPLGVQAAPTVESLRAKGFNISGCEKAWPPPSSGPWVKSWGLGQVFMYLLGCSTFLGP